jgi:hypothetical protein
MFRFNAILLAGSLLAASSASAQQRGHPPADTTWGPHRADREMMMKMMETSDARLDQLVQVMNQSTGSKKVDAIAAVINEMVTQRKIMRGHMREMMGHAGTPGP